MTDNAFDFLVPGDLDARTGGYIYDRRIVEGLRAHGWQIKVHALDASFPSPTQAALNAADETLAGIAAQRRVVVDGLAFGAMPDIATKHAARLRLIALVHHPLAKETGLDAVDAKRLLDHETRSLSAARRVITTSHATAKALSDYAVLTEQISIVRPGTDAAPLARGSASSTSSAHLNLLCVATLTPRKGHELLITALHRLADRPWRLACVGSASRHPETAARLRTQINSLGLANRVLLTDEVDDATLAAHYRQADAFVLATHYEGYGMVFDEALACGLPIVTTDAGAIPDTVPASAGLLVPAGDESALCLALQRFMDDDSLRKRLRAGARAARLSLRSWPQACDEFAAAVSFLDS